MRDMIFVAQERANMTAILADANKPDSYVNQLLAVDAVFQDIAQRDQAGIFLKNCERFLKSGGFGILCVKSRSIDVAKQPKEVFKDVRAKLERRMAIVDYRELDPFEKDHCIFVCKKK